MGMVYWDGRQTHRSGVTLTSPRRRPVRTGRGRRRSDAATLVPFAGVPYRQAGLLALQCVRSSNGLFVRVHVVNLSDRPVTGLRVEATTMAGQRLMLTAADDTDLTAIPARGSIGMDVQAWDHTPGELPLRIELRFDPDRWIVFTDIVPVDAEPQG